jgi:hypothetical protein
MAGSRETKEMTAMTAFLRISLPSNVFALVVLGGLLLSCSPALGTGHGSTIQVTVSSPCCSNPSYAKEDDLLLQSVTWDDGTVCDQFIFASAVTDVAYEGSTYKLRVVTGHESTVGDPGVFHIQDEDGDGDSISSEDLDLFADRILNAWNHNNINAYVHRRTNALFSFIVEYEEVIRDNDAGDDDVGELLVFEISGNSWVQIEAVDEDGNILGTPVVVGHYLKISPYNLYTRKYNNDGDPTCGHYDIKAIGVDLSDLGVTEARRFRVRSPENPPGGGDIKACFRVVGVQTFDAPTSAMVFD